MSNKAKTLSALLVLSALSQESDRVEDAFENVEQSEIDESEANFQKFVEELRSSFKKEENHNSAFVYDQFRKHFPIGEKSSEIALIPLLATFVERLFQAPDLSALLEALGERIGAGE